MEQGYLHQVLPFLREIAPERRKQIEEYFSSAPVWLMDSFQIVKMDKGVTFVTENAPVDMVYIVGEGMIKGLDYRIFGIKFDFMHFGGIYAMGGMEVVMDLERYQTTLQTVTPCVMITIPKAQFSKWLQNDIKALKQEAKAVGSYLLEESRRNRALLFLQGSDRLSMLLIDKYQREAQTGSLRITETRQELAEESGLCVKTINRSVKKLEEDGLLTRTGNHITMNQNQYRKMNELVSQIVER